MLTQFVLTNAKPKAKPYKLSDGDGLSLLVESNGSTLWRFRYFFGGKEKMLTFGAFPEVSLAEAREKRHDARKLLAQGVNPSEKRKADKAGAVLTARNTFKTVADEYQARLKQEGRSEATLAKNKWLLDDLASPLANRPLTDITSAEILDLLQRIERTGRRDPLTVFGKSSAASSVSPS